MIIRLSKDKQPFKLFNLVCHPASLKVMDFNFKVLKTFSYQPCIFCMWLWIQRATTGLNELAPKVASFCYLDDMLSAGGGCDITITTRVKTAWKKFRELLPVLASRNLSYKTLGHVYSSCVRSAILNASETWPLTKTNLQRLQRNDRIMIRQICSNKPEDVATVM